MLAEPVGPWREMVHGHISISEKRRPYRFSSHFRTHALEA
jgi:hypothetical protein